jgi:radical SAM superfamily enzyme YgiQ (UPF0313 family)
LDALPFPDLSEVTLENYHCAYTPTQTFMTMMTTRGCPFKCNYCDAPVTMGKKLRKRSAANIVDEILLNQEKYGIQTVTFKDSTFTANKKHVHDMCDEVLRRGLRFHWSCNTRVELVNDELLAKMRAAGCYQIFYGIESGDQEVLDNFLKGTTLAQAEEAVHLTKKNKMKVTGYFMFGNFGETPEKAQKTIDFAKKLDLDFATFGIAQAYPNTGLYHRGLKEGVLDKDWYMKNSTGGLVCTNGYLNLPNFTPAQQEKMLKKAINTFYFSPKYMLKTLFSIDSLEDIKRVIRGASDVLGWTTFKDNSKNLLASPLVSHAD